MKQSIWMQHLVAQYSYYKLSHQQHHELSFELVCLILSTAFVLGCSIGGLANG